jgi:hypothetical protein
MFSVPAFHIWSTAMTPLLLFVASLLPPPDDFDARFTGLTLRFDYHHCGTSGAEHVCLDRLRLEGPWPGSRTQLHDETNLGKYRFELVDAATHRVLYSRGFCSIYGEWETTGEAREGMWRSFHESQRFPEPRARAQVVLKKRGDDGAFRELFAHVFDPQSRFVDRSAIAARGSVSALFASGPAARKVDLLVLADGYTADQAAKFEADAQRLVAALFAVEPFRSRRGDFNVRTLHVPAAEEGISSPRDGVWRDNPLGTRYNSFDSDRYVLTYANRALRDAAAQAPYDALAIVCNSPKYGGGGILNLWTTCAADAPSAEYVFVHEFGHSFAGLGDEYYSSEVAYEEFVPPGVEPWEPNITALLDPQKLKWGALVEEGTPIPTPWDQKAYDAAVRERERGAEVPLQAGGEHGGKVGAFEGACYQAEGLYRPYADCIMFSRNPGWFCPVCRRAIARAIDLYSE